MAIPGTGDSRHGYSDSAAAVDGRRLLALPGVVAVVGALVTAAISFAILVGVDADRAGRDHDARADRHQRAFRSRADRADRPRGAPHRHGARGAARRHRGCMCASSRCSRWSRRCRPSWSRSSHRSRSTSGSTAGSRSAPRRSSIRRCRSPKPMCRRTPATCRARRSPWPTTSTMRARSTISTAPASAIS